jgi:uncharacterized membrane protein YccC
VSFAFARKFWQFDSSLISKRTALRDALAVAAALSLGLAAGGPTIAVIMAIGAIATAMADGPEAVRVRLVRLLVAASAAALSAFAGAVTGGYPWLAVPTLAAWAFVCGLVVALGADATTVGLNSLVVFIVLEHSALDPFRAASLAALVFGGGLVTTIASALALPSRVSPPQRAIAAAYAHLADLAAAPPHGHAMPPVSVPIAQAKHALQFFGSQHEVRGEALRTLLDQAERLRIEILSLEEWRDVELDRHDPTAPPVTTALAAVATALRGVSTALVRSAATSEIAAACATIETERERIAKRRGVQETDPLPAAIVRVLDAVMGQLRAADAAVRDAVTGFDLLREVTGALHVPLPPLRATLATLRANLTFDSTAFRHALRLAACVTVAATIVHLAHLPRGYWLPMTAALVLKPDFGETYARGVMRVVGTLLGIAVAFALHAAGIATNEGRIAIIFVAVFAARSFGRPNYAFLTLSITIYVVELLAISGESIDRTIGERTLNTLLGGGLALAFYAIWPTWERGRLRVVLADLIAAYRTYWNAVMARMARPRLRDDDPAEAVLHDARIASRVARTNAQASLERARAEPAPSITELDLCAGILAAAHRFVLSTLRLETAAVTQASLPQTVAAYAADVDRTLVAIEETLRGAELPSDLPDLREAHRALTRTADDDASRLFAFEADNVANSLDTIVELLRRDARASTRRTRALNIKRLRRIARSS